MNGKVEKYPKKGKHHYIHNAVSRKNSINAEFLVVKTIGK